jgi:hypothetical protein
MRERLAFAAVLMIGLSSGGWAAEVKMSEGSKESTPSNASAQLRKEWVGRVFRLSQPAVTKTSDPREDSHGRRTYPQNSAPLALQRWADNPHGSYLTVPAGTELEVVGLQLHRGPGRAWDVATIYLLRRDGSDALSSIVTTPLRPGDDGHWHLGDTQLASVLKEDPALKPEWTLDRWEALKTRSDRSSNVTIDWALLKP